MDTKSMVLGYWGIRGKAGLLRNLLAYCNLSYQNKLYNDFAEWFGKDKHTLGFDYPNLPYIIDGDKKITETNAIVYYIPIKAGKRELIGDTDEKFIQVQVVNNVIQDVANELLKISENKTDFATLKEEAFSKGNVKAKLEILNKNFEGKEFLCGFLSIADFGLFEMVEFIHDMDSVKLEPYANLTSFYKRFLEIPQVKAHRQSSDFNKVWFPPGESAWNNL